MGIDQGAVPGDGVAALVSRLPGQEVTWGSCELRRRPDPAEQKSWRHRWNPYRQCSWPPEDQRIESFQTHVREQARALLGADLARSEKFTTSVMDGLDIRETLRHWHTGDLYVKVIPPSRGSIEVVVFLFDTPADPKHYPQRATWGAEHDRQAWMTFFATGREENIVGPGIALCEYGGLMLLFPPRHYPDIWADPRLNFTDSLEERLLAGAALHSKERHVVVVSASPPQAIWRRAARRFGKKLVHLPAGRFSNATLERLRHFHVLNGHEVRTYAAEFIRDFN